MKKNIIMSSQLIIYSPKSEPYGLLSNNARMDKLEADGNYWPTVSDYIYRNIYNRSDWRDDMRLYGIDGAYANPYSDMIKIIEKEESNVIYKLIGDEMKRRFTSADDNIYDNRLRSINKPVIALTATNPIDQEIVTYLNQRLSVTLSRDRIYDKVLHWLPKRQVAQLYASIYRLVERGVNIDPRTDYTLAYEKWNDDTIVVPEDRRVQIIDRVAQFIPHSLNLLPALAFLSATKSRRSNEIEKFKQDLLNTYLDYILETKYPNVRPEQYADAKRQQIITHSDRASSYADKLYQMFLDGRIVPQVVERLDVSVLDVPQYDVKESLDSYENEMMSRLNEDVVKSDDDDVELLSEYDVLLSSDVSVSSPSFGHVVIEKLAKEFIPDVDYRKRIQLNRGSSTMTLWNEYNAVKVMFLAKRIAFLNDKIQSIKYSDQRYATFRALLASTVPMGIQWGDTSDPVLGYNGDNLTGKTLTRLAVESNRGTFQTAMSTFPQMYDNALVKFWMVTEAQDITSTINMFRMGDVSLKDMRSIYVVSEERGKRTPQAPQKWMSKLDDYFYFIGEGSGASKKNILTIIMPLLHVEYPTIFGSSDDLTLGEAVGNYVRSHDQSEPSTSSRNDVIEYFSLLYDKLDERRYFIVSKSEFIAKLLSGNTTCGPLNWRVNMFARRLDRMRRR